MERIRHYPIRIGEALMSYANIGQALAKAFARNGIEVSVATTRDPESFASAGQKDDVRLDGFRELFGNDRGSDRGRGRRVP
jgi:NADP oxidoreductase coenzyme F420-dependent